MKFVRAVSHILIVCSLALMTGCSKNDDVVETGQSTSPNFSFRGGLAFHVKDSNGSPVPGATMAISLSQSELNNGTYLMTRTTNSDGRADFGQLNADNYYYRVDVTINNVYYHGDGVVQVQAGENLLQELTIQ